MLLDMRFETASLLDMRFETASLLDVRFEIERVLDEGIRLYFSVSCRGVACIARPTIKSLQLNRSFSIV